MPPVIPAGPVIRVQYRCSLGDDLDVLSRLFFNYTGSPPDGTQCEALAGSIWTLWGSNFGPLAGTDVAIQEVVVTDLSSLTAAQGSYTATAAGGRSGAILPAACACLINFQIARRYRGGKPRVYMPFGTDSDLLTPQGWTGGFLTEVDGNFSDHIASILTHSWSDGVIVGQVSVSFYEGTTVEEYGTPPYQRARNVPIRRATPLIDPVTFAAANPILGSQRRRNRPK